MDMDLFAPRKLVFKAWNTKTRLLMRLNSIDCVKGELVKEDHYLLQFTGRTDQHGEELYEMDVVLIGSKKFVVVWKDELPGWYVASFSGDPAPGPLTVPLAQRATRLCSYFETARP